MAPRMCPTAPGKKKIAIALGYPEAPDNKLTEQANDLVGNLAVILRENDRASHCVDPALLLLLREDPSQSARTTATDSTQPDQTM